MPAPKPFVFTHNVPPIHSDASYRRHVPNMSEEEYNADKGLRATLVKKLDTLAPGIARLHTHSSSAMNLGTILHDCLPSCVGQGKYAVVEDARTKAGKEAKADAEAQGMPVVNRATADRLEGMLSAVAAHPWFQGIVKDHHETLVREQSVFATICDVRCKARIDAAYPSGPNWVLIDWKTCADASPHGFARAAAKYSYPLQQVHYSRVWNAAVGNIEQFLFAAIQSAPPYYMAVYELKRDWVSKAQQRHSEILGQYSRLEDIAPHNWPAYNDVMLLGNPFERIS